MATKMISHSVRVSFFCWTVCSSTEGFIGQIYGIDGSGSTRLLFQNARRCRHLSWNEQKGAGSKPGLVVASALLLAGVQKKQDFGWLVLGLFFCSGATALRSEERRVGKECRSRWSPYH